MVIEFKFADESQKPTMVQMADAMPRIGESVQILVNQTPVMWEVYDVVHNLRDTSSYDRTTVFLKKQAAKS